MHLKLCLILSVHDILKNVEWITMKPDSGDFHSTLNTLFSFGYNKPRQLKEKPYIKTYMEQIYQNG